MKRVFLPTVLAILCLLLVIAPLGSNAEDRAIVQRLAGANLEIKTHEQLDKLRGFAGTPFAVRMPAPVALKGISDLRAQHPFASADVARMIDDLQTSAHWKHDDHECFPGLARHGLIVVTWIDARRQRNVEERRAYEAAQALRCYLFARFGAWPMYWEATDLFECPDLPRNGVVVEVGIVPTENERLPKFNDPQFERCADELQARTTQ